MVQDGVEAKYVITDGLVKVNGVMASSSKRSPKLPKVISAANRIANGNEAGTNVRAE